MYRLTWLPLAVILTSPCIHGQTAPLRISDEPVREICRPSIQRLADGTVWTSFINLQGLAVTGHMNGNAWRYAASASLPFTPLAATSFMDEARTTWIWTSDSSGTKYIYYFTLKDAPALHLLDASLGNPLGIAPAADSGMWCYTGITNAVPMTAHLLREGQVDKSTQVVPTTVWHTGRDFNWYTFSDGLGLPGGNTALEFDHTGIYQQTMTAGITTVTGVSYSPGVATVRLDSMRFLTEPGGYKSWETKSAGIGANRDIILAATQTRSHLYTVFPNGPVFYWTYSYKFYLLTPGIDRVWTNVVPDTIDTRIALSRGPYPITVGWFAGGAFNVRYLRESTWSAIRRYPHTFKDCRAPAITVDADSSLWVTFAATTDSINYHVYVQHLPSVFGPDVPLNVPGRFEDDVPNSLTLQQNFPNPFNGTTVVEYLLPTSSTIRLVVYDILGKEVRVIAEGRQESGSHHVMLDASSMASGAYLVRLSTPDGVRTRLICLLR